MTVPAVVLAAALAACAVPHPDPVAATAGTGPGPGWRKGLVVQAGDRDSLGPPIDGDCRDRARAGDGNEAPRGADVPRRYVEVQYFVGRHAHLRIVPIDDALDVVAGDPVWFRSFGCANARKAGPAAS